MAERSGSGGTDADGTGRGSESADGAESSDSVESTDGTDPTAVFELLADETRLAIVRELAAERQSNWQWAGATFAELRRAVGVEDAGNFSYHLEKLRGPLVVKDGDTYHLLNRGLQLVGAVESGRYTGAGESLRRTTEYECPYPDCDRNLDVVYENQFCRFACPDHHRFSGTMLPPAAVVDRSTEELARIATMDMRQEVRRARQGVCPLCRGPVETSLPAPDPTLPSLVPIDVPEDTVFVTFDCDHCGLSFDVPPGACVVDHPAVVAFYHEHDRSLRGRPYICIPFCHFSSADLTSTDPIRVRLDVEFDGDRLSLWLDGETNVVEYERE